MAGNDDGTEKVAGCGEIAMTEGEWLACTDPEPMLDFLRIAKASERKLRLFACACCRRIWHLIADRRSEEAIEFVERIESVPIEKEQREMSKANAQAACVNMSVRDLFNEPSVFAARSAYQVATRGNKSVYWAVRNAAWAIAVENGCREPRKLGDNPGYCNQTAFQCVLLRDIFNPFRPITINSSWQTPTILALAQSAYDNRDLPAGTLQMDRLAVLADALEEAGCDSEEVLNHLRGSGPHVRGCWVVDSLLARE